VNESTKVDLHVKTWYAQKRYWGPQGKTAEWPDRVLLDQGKLIDGKDVLNLGCFYPEDEFEFAERASRWIAIDFVLEVIERARAAAHERWPGQYIVQFKVADMRALPFAGSSFDVVTDFSSGDHLLREDWHKTIVEAYRVLRPGGYFLVCFANRYSFINVLKHSELGVSWAEQPEQFCEYGYIRTDTPEGMATMLEERGFNIVRASHCGVTELRSGLLARKP
jgi:SAM-dependent methyltransferase